jgi:VanZ like family/Concanavalin A-like lectin/glucanases superfamily
MMKKTANTRQTLGVICLLVLCAVLVAALWPFHAPVNEVNWLANENGVRFGRNGTILSRGEFQTKRSSEPSYTLEICLTPASGRHWHSIMAFYSKQNHYGFGFGQTGYDLFLVRHTLDQQGQWRIAVYVGDIFRKDKTLFVTIAAGPQGTEVYVDGALARVFPQFRTTAHDIRGELVIGTSPVRDAGWPGELHGLAIYERELTPEEIVRNYTAWSHNGGPNPDNVQSAAALYTFDERSGDTVHNRLKSGPDLHIPTHYMIFDKPLLLPVWKEYSGDWGYWESVVLNIIAFVPLGFFVCSYLSLSPAPKKPLLIAIFLGGALSLTVEILQAYLPTRESGTTDIITNTSGTAIGAMLFNSSWLKELISKFGLFAIERDAAVQLKSDNAH